MNLKEGDRVRVSDNYIFAVMGYEVVTGTVFLVYQDGLRFSIRCDQTRCIEVVDFNDGTIEKEG